MLSGRIRVEAAIDHFGQAMHYVVLGVVQPYMLAALDELSQARLELVEQETIEGDARYRATIAKVEIGRNATTSIRDRNRIERPVIVLEQRAFAEPTAWREVSESGVSPVRPGALDL